MQVVKDQVIWFVTIPHERCLFVSHLDHLVIEHAKLSDDMRCFCTICSHDTMCRTRCLFATFHNFSQPKLYMVSNVKLISMIPHKRMIDIKITRKSRKLIQICNSTANYLSVLLERNMKPYSRIWFTNFRVIVSES